MFSINSVAEWSIGRWLLGLQAALALAILLASLGPAPGQAALYVPLATASQAQGIAWARRNGGALLGPGPLPGSLVIQARASANVLSAAAEGALLVSSPGPLCGQDAIPQTPSNAETPHA